MPVDDIKTLKRKVDSIITNIKIYQRDIARYIEKLKNEYDTNELEDIEPLIEDLENRVKKINKRRDKLIAKADKILKGIQSD